MTEPILRTNETTNTVLYIANILQAPHVHARVSHPDIHAYRFVSRLASSARRAQVAVSERRLPRSEVLSEEVD